MLVEFFSNASDRSSLDNDGAEVISKIGPLSSPKVAFACVNDY